MKYYRINEFECRCGCVMPAEVKTNIEVLVLALARVEVAVPALARAAARRLPLWRHLPSAVRLRLPDGRQRMPGGGAKKKVDKHPEWVAVFEEIISGHMAGLPQDEDVVWTGLSAPQIRREFLKRGLDVSCHVVRGMLASAGQRTP